MLNLQKRMTVTTHLTILADCHHIITTTTIILSYDTLIITYDVGYLNWLMVKVNYKLT